MSDERNSPTTDDRLRPEMHRWRSHNGYAILRLRTDVRGASYTSVKRPGDLVLARWHTGIVPFAKGWMLHDIGFTCILNEPDVEVMERP